MYNFNAHDVGYLLSFWDYFPKMVEKWTTNLINVEERDACFHMFSIRLTYRDSLCQTSDRFQALDSFLGCLIYGRKDESKQFLEVTEKDASLPVVIFKWNNTRNHHSKHKKTHE